MVLFTHLHISMKLKRILEKKFNIKLNTISFMLGSIKPDLVLKYINIPHYKESSEEFFCKEIQSLLETDIYEYNKCTSQCSERLGILTHYLSDFFCHAHSKYFTGGMPQHYIYEMQLSKYYAMHSKSINQSCYDINIETNHNTSTICSYIDKLYAEYLCGCKQADPCFDISFTLRACTFLCSSIISTCMVGEESYSITAEEILL